MPEEKKPGDQTSEFTPASPIKRTLAWMGIVYMIILVLLTTYNLATGEPLHGIPGILLFPACGGLAAISWLKYRDSKKKSFFLLAILAACACILNLIIGSMALLHALGG